MQSSQPSKPRRFDVKKRTNTVTGPKSNGPGSQKEDKNMNTTTPRRVTKVSTAPSRTRPVAQPRAPVIQPRLSTQKSTVSRLAKPKPKSTIGSAKPRNAAAAPLSLPSVLPLDPNCNEPSLPCLCCDGRSPQDSNSMFNHNHNNNNTISIRQQLQLPPPPAQLLQKHDGRRDKEPLSQAQTKMEPPSGLSASLGNGEKKMDTDVNNKNKIEEEDDEESSGAIDTDDEEEADNNDEDDDDDDTLVPSCCEGPPSFLDFSLSSSTSSSSSTSISSCSDLESDCVDLSSSLCSSHGLDNLSPELIPQSQSIFQVPECLPPARSPPSLPLSQNPFLTSHCHVGLCSPDEGFPSALNSPSPDYLGVSGDSEVTKLGLLDFLESVGEFGKMERFSQVIQVARWDLEGEQHWDVLRDRLDHLDRLEKVNREVKLAYIARLHEKGFDLGDLEEQDLTDVMDEMGNIDIPWKLYRTRDETMGHSQEFSDAGVDLTAPSDCDDLIADSLTPSPVEPPPRPPKPPARYASVSSDLHTYINISRETTSMAVTTSPTLSTFSSNASSPTFTTFRCEKPLLPSPPFIPPLPVSKHVPYLTLYTTPSPPPSLPTPTPPIPPPRRRHLARKEAQRLAALQAEREKTPVSLPPPTTRPPPLPPPPVISVTSSSPPAIPPPPTLPPPPSFHALDVEIRKLLMLAGLTQAELLKLSPELSVCVGELEYEEDGDDQILSRSLESNEFRLQDSVEEKEYDKDGWINMRKANRDKKSDTDEKDSRDEESKNIQKTTSFTEMARRRRRNVGLTTDPYYTTSCSNSLETNAKNTNHETFCYPNKLPDSPPPPPPPRPLPPIPPSVPSLKVSTLPDNSKQPERFDWLIAFTPECEAPPREQPYEKKKSFKEHTNKHSSSSSSPCSAPKVTTFKELRFRSKNVSPPTKVISEPEPDPMIVTPDPDILYNLKWRREKAGSDGNQWEYTSQAQALFMQPPPALTSMDALKEMLQRADKEGGKLQLCTMQKIGCSTSDSNLLTINKDGEEKKRKKEEEEMVEMRGRADGGRTLDSKASISSPPLSLAHSQPYFLHSALPPFRPGYCNSQPLAYLRPNSHVGQESSEKPRASTANSTQNFTDDSLVDYGALDHEDVFMENPHSANQKISDSNANKWELAADSICNINSLYSSDSEELIDPHYKSGTPVSKTAELAGCTTPYKNIDVMLMYADSDSAADSLNPRKHSIEDSGSSKARAFKELPPLPTYYLYHPKNCPLHRGAPPRLSPIGALSPPQRTGAPPPGAAGSGLGSPFFPRSYTLPALAAPLYYPNLYPSLPPTAPPLPPKLYQAPLQSHVATVRSISFAGSIQKSETPWMGEDVKHPLRGFRLPAQCLLEKKALVSAVSVAVEAILAQFSSCRTVVQKALSGDSTVNPSLGRLVLQCFCPALHSLLTDGLRPHQSDLIAGRRPNSAWSLIQASTKPGPKTQALFNLQVRVGGLFQLKQSKQRFNAFLLGLLNAKLLDSWLSHLQSCSDVLETYYHPTSFMHLSLGVCRPLFEELLLVLQPLSLLTFNLDLLFQHHHLEPDSHKPEIPSPLAQDTGFPQAVSKIPCGKYMESLTEVDFGNPGQNKDSKSSPCDNLKSEESGPSENREAAPARASLPFSQTSPQLLWVQEKDISGLPPPNMEEDSFAQHAGQMIQQGLGAVMRWGGRLSQNLADMSLSAVRKDEVKTGQSEVQTQAESDYTAVSSSTQVLYSFGRLFGASKSPNNPTGIIQPTRRPSQWLAPGVTALTRMVSSNSAPILRRIPEPIGGELEPEKDVDTQECRDKARPLRSVRTLCDHAGTGSELTFCKGEELVVLAGVDQDWIRCRQGDKEGLVPIGYTSLIM